jgi:thioredoxin 1
MFKVIGYLILALTLLLTPAITGCYSKSGPTTPSISWSEAISNGKPTLAEFGRGTCVPCQQMKPILEELAVEYESKLNVLIISVDTYAALTRQFQILAIPTQIFLDKDGKEVSRHVGYFAKKDIINTLITMGIE